MYLGKTALNLINVSKNACRGNDGILALYTKRQRKFSYSCEKMPRFPHRCLTWLKAATRGLLHALLPLPYFP
jgi:hypothetical protein